MADGRAPTPPTSDRPGSWREIFRCAQVALDPRKLFVAAVGILVMSFLWWFLSYAFYTEAPKRSDNDYSTEAVSKDFEGKTNPQTGKPYTNEEREPAVAAEANRRFSADYAQWKVLDGLAGPGGRLRTMPWYEYRGPNPFLFLTDVISGSAAERSAAVGGFLSGSVPVLVEPLVKLLIPVAKLISPDVNLRTRIYLFLILLVNVAVWAFAGGIITRMAAIHLANKGPVSLGQAYRFVRNRYLAYIGSPLVPLIIVFACVVGLVLYGVLGLIPFVGDLLVLGLGLPVVIIGGAVMAIFLVGLVGYPLMYPTLSAEGDQSDTFDALSRSINYVYQSPWAYIWYWLVAIAYGAAVALFVLFFGSLTVYVGKWAVGLTASTVWTERKPEFLFIYSPESFGWKELLTKDSPYAVRGGWVLVKDGKEYGSEPARTVMLTKDGKETTNPAEAARTVAFDRDNREVLPNAADADRQVYRYTPVDRAANDRARAEFYQYNYWGAGIVAFWLALLFLMLLGFSYSFFWTAATMIYFLMRKRVDEAELDEVYVEDEEPEPPLAPPKIADGTGAPPAAGSPTSLPVIAPPANIPPVPAPPPVSPPPLPPIPVVTTPPPPPPATLPFTPPPPPAPAAAVPPATYTTPEPPPKASDEWKPREEPKREEPKRDEPKKTDDEAPLG